MSGQFEDTPRFVSLATSTGLDIKSHSEPIDVPEESTVTEGIAAVSCDGLRDMPRKGYRSPEQNPSVADMILIGDYVTNSTNSCFISMLVFYKFYCA